MKDNSPLELDVRPLLASGSDPFQAIMEAKARLAKGQALSLTAPFEPLPLIDVFAAEGYAAESERVADNEWRIHFTPGTQPAPKQRDLDARELEPPGPLQVALQAISELGREEILVLRTRFRPVHLFEELDGQDFDWETDETGPQDWTTHLWRVTGT